MTHCFARLLEESNHPDDRDYSAAAVPILEALIHGHYLSQQDVEICAALYIAGEFNTQTNLAGIESLPQSLRTTSTEPEAAARRERGQ